METYEVLRDFPQNGKAYRKGSKINLTARQARHLVIGGFVRRKDEQVKADAKKSQGKGGK